MGCNSRTSYWDIHDPEQESILNFTPNVCFGTQSTEENSVGDLKLGRLSDMNNFVGKLKNPMASASSSRSYKRARAPNNALLVPSCLVDGCDADLKNCRDYHKRHKVCEAHSKTPRVTIGGQERRFCQQCSRFHSLEEFDDSKRSCRKRLDGHNRRRRKPQSGSLSMHTSKYIPTHQGSKFMSYGTQYFPNSAWNDVVKGQNNHIYSPNWQLNHKTINLSDSGYSGEKQFPFLQGVADISGSNSSQKMLFPDRASSLLSSSPHTETCGFNPTHFVPHYLGHAMESVSNSSNANMDCPEMIQNVSDACQQTIAFSWS